MVSDALGELFPMLDVENMPLELKLLGGMRTFFGGSKTGSVAANLNHVQLFNPDESEALVIVERVILTSNTAQEIEYAMTNSAITNNIGNIHPRDTRLTISDSSVAQNRQVTQVGGLPTIGIFRLEQNVSFDLFNANGLFCLAPNSGITFAAVSTNSSLAVTWHWRERVAESSELDF